MYTPNSNLTVTIYKDANREWRWRVQAGNNRNIANGGEGYKNKADVIDSVMDILALNTLEAHGKEFASEPSSYTATRQHGNRVETVRIEMSA